ncbi:MAG: hypothetical protein IPH77_10485 [Ignavibacteria bacterium]|nr:hypothetical protein [Ignavibacteria bacterium]
MNKTLLTVILFAFHFSIKTVSAQGPVVINVSPLKQVINAPRNSLITVTFNAPVDTLSVNETSFRVFSRLSGPVPGTFDFGAADKLVRFTLIHLFLPENGLQLLYQKALRIQIMFRWRMVTAGISGQRHRQVQPTIH